MPGYTYLFGKQAPYAEVVKMNVLPITDFLDQFKIPDDQRKKLIKSHLNTWLKKRPVPIIEKACGKTIFE